MTTPTPEFARQMANAIRMLAVDAVEKAKSGHPGAPMGMADIAEVLWNRHLQHNPTNPLWPDRDRFVLSNGHGSMLIYALLHLTGYDLPMSELKNFRQLDSKTAGHPEVGVTPGVETTTGPLGQGITNAVGMAFGQYLVDRLGFQWVAVFDDHCAEVAVVALPGRGDLLIFPPNLVGKRWQSGVTAFLVPIYEEVAANLRRLKLEWSRRAGE